MTTHKHTPGPWRVSTNGNVIADLPDGGHMFIASPKHPEAPTVEHPMRDASARLIAAAPDLLAALRAMVAHEGERQTNGIGLESDSDALIAARAAAESAIAKAEGRE